MGDAPHAMDIAMPNVNELKYDKILNTKVDDEVLAALDRIRNHRKKKFRAEALRELILEEDKRIRTRK
jgi:hypothetical protein